MIPFQVVAEALTVVPVSAGAGVGLEVGPRLRARTSLGAMPGPYRDGILAAVGAIEPQFTDQQAALVDASLKGPVVWRSELGWRPFPTAGLYLHGTYTLVTLGGATTGADVVEELAGVTLPPGVGGELSVSATLHQLGPEVGWDQPLGPTIHLRLGVGWNFTVAAHTRLRADLDGVPLEADLLVNQAADLGAHELVRYGHPPTVTIGLGWAFGPRSAQR
jgi:hypothetical protein